MNPQPMDTETNNQNVNFNSYKVLLLGNSYVGKTCILIRYSEDSFKENYDVTIGLNYRIKTMTI